MPSANQSLVNDPGFPMLKLLRILKLVMLLDFVPSSPEDMIYVNGLPIEAERVAA
jgi:hypothetical protein